MPRALILGDSSNHDVFEILELDEKRMKARAPFLFEIGEELRLEIEDGPRRREVTAIVRSHGPDHVSELELIV